MADTAGDQGATATQPPAQTTTEPPAQAAPDAGAIKMDLMAQAQALQYLSAQATAEAMRLPEQRLDEKYAEPGDQVFDVLAPDGKTVMYRMDGNGNEVKGRRSRAGADDKD